MFIFSLFFLVIIPAFATLGYYCGNLILCIHEEHVEEETYYETLQYCFVPEDVSHTFYNFIKYGSPGIIISFVFILLLWRARKETILLPEIKNE